MNPGRLDALLAEVDRLQRQVAELQHANAALREALSQAQMDLVSSRTSYRNRALFDDSQSREGQQWTP